MLESIVERLVWMDTETTTSDSATLVPPTSGSEVFVVHGHDLALRDRVELAVRRVGLDPVILAAQTNRGRTIIETFEDESSDRGYAVVLLSPDDLGWAKSTNPPDTPNRARQNVILELGYLIGKLGRRLVSAVYVDGVELPSDVDGVVYIPADDKIERALARELHAADLPADLTRISNPDFLAEPIRLGSLPGGRVRVPSGVAYVAARGDRGSRV